MPLFHARYRQCDSHRRAAHRAAVWFDSLEISSATSGAIFAAPSIATVLLTIFIGGLADKFADWRTAIIVCNSIGLVMITWLLFRQDIGDIFLVWTILGLFTLASGPIMDAAALDYSGRHGSDYGKLRAFGSIGFIVGIVCAGAYFDKLSIHGFVWVFLLGVLARVIAAFALPTFRNQSIKSTAINAESLRAFLQPGILLVLVGSALINASHGFINIFAILHWTHIGISTGMASVLWTIGVTAEVVLMWRFRTLAQGLSARKCLLLASGTATIRWLVSGTEPNLVVWFLLQSLHSITFGLMFLASVNFIARRVQPHYAAQAQSVLATLTVFFMGLSNWLSGVMYNQYSQMSFWAMAAIALLGGVLIALSYRSELEDVKGNLTP